MATHELDGAIRVVHTPDDIARRSQGVSGKRLLLVVAGATLVGAVAWLGWYWWTTGRFVQWTDDAYIGAEVTPLSSRGAGFIERVAVVDNQSVKAGDLLIKIDDRDYRAQLAHAEASVAVQQATLANLDAKRHLQEAAIEEASADIAATTAELARAKSDLDRYRTLSDNRIASVQRFQQADADYEKAQAAARKARAVLDAAERRLSVVDAEKQQTQAALDQAAADRDLARLNLGYTEIRAPIDGVVGNRSARAGAYATVGSQLLAIVPASALWVDANFKESQLARVRVGQPAEVIADVLPGV